MTRADIVRNIINDDGYYYTKHSVLEIVNVIYDEHEAQLKAKESDLERQDMIIKCLNIDLDNKEKLLKAKDEENERLKEAMQEFVSRVEKGEVRSSYTYSKFKELLKDNKCVV